MNTLSIGYIPKGWKKNADGGPAIEIGNPELSRVKEVTVTFDSEGVGSVASASSLKIGSIDALLKAKSASLAALVDLVIKHTGAETDPAVVCPAIKAAVTGEVPQALAPFIQIVSESGPEVPDARRYAEMWYVHYFDLQSEQDRVVILDV